MSSWRLATARRSAGAHRHARGAVDLCLRGRDARHMYSDPGQELDQTERLEQVVIGSIVERDEECRTPRPGPSGPRSPSPGGPGSSSRHSPTPSPSERPSGPDARVPQNPDEHHNSKTTGSSQRDLAPCLTFILRQDWEPRAHHAPFARRAVSTVNWSGKKQSGRRSSSSAPSGRIGSAPTAIPACAPSAFIHGRCPPTRSPTVVKNVVESTRRPSTPTPPQFNQRFQRCPN